jgi:hypothetical protein
LRIEGILNQSYDRDLCLRWLFEFSRREIGPGAHESAAGNLGLCAPGVPALSWSADLSIVGGDGVAESAIRWPS